jgi:hypothetical protein
MIDSEFTATKGARERAPNVGGVNTSSARRSPRPPISTLFSSQATAPAASFLPGSLAEGAAASRRITDAELVCLGIAQVLFDKPSDRLFLAWARWRIGHLFPYLPTRSAYNRRMRRLATRLVELLAALAWDADTTYDNLRLLDSTPLPCAQSRETVRRSELAGLAPIAGARSTRASSGGFRLDLVASPNGMPVGFGLAPANVPEREAAKETLPGCLREGRVVLGEGLCGTGVPGLRRGLRGKLHSPGSSR